MINSKTENGIIRLRMSGSPSEVGAELAAALYEFQKRARQELGKENGNQLTREIVSVIEPKSEMRKTVKKAMREGKEMEL